MTSDGTDSYSYSANGTLSSVAGPSGTTASAFDAYGEQASAGGQSYSYDALGRLAADSGAGAGYAFSYLGASQSLASDGSYDYTWDPSGTALAGTAPAGSGGTGAVLALADQHGDVVGQFTGSGTGLAGSRSYDPWGTATAVSGSMAGNLGYQSGWTEPATGNVHMGARWYSPATGGFTSRDTAHVPPAPDSGAASPFGYAGGNPLGNTDPSGHYISAGSAAGGAAAPESQQEQVEAGIALNQAQEAEQGRLSAAQNALNAARSLLSSFGDVVRGLWDLVSGHWPAAKAAAEAALGRARAALASAEAAAGEVEASAVRSAESEYNSFEKQMAAAERATAAKLADAKKKALAVAAAAGKAIASAGSRVYHSVVAAGAADVREVATAVHAVARVATATGNFVKAHAGAITSVVVGGAVMFGCEATLGATSFGAATPVCAALSGAAGAAAGYAVNAAQHGGFSWSGLGEATAVGAVAGLAGAGLGSLGGTAAKGLGIDTAALGAAARSLAGGLLSSGDGAAESALASGAVDDVGGALSDGSAAEGAAPGDTLSGQGAEAPAPAEGDSGGGSCPTNLSFTAGTLVLLASGKAVPIASLKVGDKVLAEDTRTGKDQPETVTAVMVHHDTDLYNLKVKTAHGTEVIHTTSNHPFYDPVHKTWVTAGKLAKGEPLRTPGGTTAAYADGGTIPTNHTGDMWDLTVPGNNDHDFYVEPAQAGSSRYAYADGSGGTPVLVHNCGETYYRTMSNEDHATLEATGKLPASATGETMISPTESFSSNYEGKMVKFTVRPGTTDALADVGVRDTSTLASEAYPDMPEVSKGWMGTSAFFKGDGTQVNIGLGRGPALDIFNDAITGIEEIPR